MELMLNSNQVSIFKDVHFITHFLNLKRSRSEHTAISYERDICDFFHVPNVECVTTTDIISVNVFHVENYIIELQSKGYASATINRKLSSLSALYKWLLRFQDNTTGKALILFNPFGNIQEDRPQVNSKETEFLTQEECVKLLSVFDTSNILDLRNKTILSLALTTALRKSEMINIKLSDIKKHAEYDVIEVIRKGNKKDMIKIQPEVMDLINQYVADSKRDFKKNKNDYLFVGHSSNSTGKSKLDPSTLNYMIKSVCKKAGITKQLKVHSTRHTAITLAITGGASIEKVRDFAGHRTLNTTNRYIHSIDNIKNNASDLINIFE